MIERETVEQETLSCFATSDIVIFFLFKEPILSLHAGILLKQCLDVYPFECRIPVRSVKFQVHSVQCHLNYILTVRSRQEFYEKFCANLMIYDKIHKENLKKSVDYVKKVC